MGNLKYNLLIFQQSEQFPEDLPEFMLAKGFGAQVVTDFTTILPTATRLQGTILLIDGGADSSAQVETAQYILNFSELHSFPLIFISKEATRYRKILSQYFKICYVLPPGSKTRNIYATLQKIEKDYKPKYDHVVLDTDVTAQVSGWSTEREAQSEPAESIPDTIVHEVVEDFGQFPDFFFDQLHKLNKVDLPVGGKDFHRTTSLEALSLNGMLPADDNQLEAISDLVKWFKPAEQERVCRTSYTSSSINRALQLPRELQQLAKSASMLYAQSLTGPASGLLLRTYMPGDDKIATEFSEKLLLSANYLHRELGDPELVAIVEAMAELARGKTPKVDPGVYAVASSLLAADMANKMCFQVLGWTPRGVHALMRKIKGGSLSNLHPVVLSCLVKFLNEAVSEVQLITSPEEDEGKARVVHPDGRKEQKIPLISLTPGMRLAQSLIARDGKVVIEEGTRLDADLIWRIWQLAAVRMLKSPFVFMQIEKGGSKGA